MLLLIFSYTSTSHTLLLSDYSYYTRLTKYPRFYTWHGIKPGTKQKSIPIRAYLFSTS
ncbi:hypothetical protein M109_3731 [Bacteroides fragilis str. 3397 N2]|nr:hypothetical protein M080_3520 [Bacteroides fragilis str. 3397 T10]EXZ47483.1 hypothetical protein M109_3731 [Bacteroides fragilis str. 3397 N2]EXZ52220.1 hypothetical protein M108_3806 [Bacteroides fragilis str. 3397 T14]EYA42135.1 hypothetical protein M110_3838 [Bacteroides fragilis str. 3397 N3]